VQIQRQPLSGGWQAWYDPGMDMLLIDPSIWHIRQQAIEQVHHELLGNHHLAPHVEHPRPHLRLVTGQGDRGVG